MIWTDDTISYYLVFQGKKTYRIAVNACMEPITEEGRRFYKQIIGGHLPVVFWGAEKVTVQRNAAIELQCVCDEVFPLEEFHQVCPKCKSVYRFDGKCISEG